MAYVISVVVTFICINAIVSHKPVFFLHGLMDDPRIFHYAISYIKENHPGTVTVTVDFFDNGMSIFPLWTQAEQVAKIIKNHPSYSENGIHLVGYSQGGLVARAVIALLEDHNIYNFITLSSPHMGVYGTWSTATKIPEIFKIFGFQLLYTPYFQMTSIGNMWNDPFRQKEYLEDNIFLPVLNNQVNHSRFFQFKENFLKLKNVVLIGGPADEVIEPWQSSQFGYYDSKENIVLMRDQQIYIKDSFGLRTLDSQGHLHLFTKDNITHHYWYRTESVIRDFVLPFLD